jgi:hypothetical protein
VRPAPAAQTQPTAASRAGYQWKQVFLPEGTRLRACFGGHHYFAQLEGGEIKYGEHAMSPSRFANLRQPAVRESGLYQSGPCQSEPSAPGGPVALIAKNSNGFQRKGGTGRDGRRKRRAMNRLPGYP